MPIFTPRSTPRFLFYLLALFWVTGCANLAVDSQASYGPKSFISAPSMTAVMVAYEPEMQGLLERIASDPNSAIESEVTIKGVNYLIGHYHQQPIVIFATGISVTNAAMTTQMALDYFPIKQVVFMGIAGAINPIWKPGDVVVPERWYYHDEHVYANPDNKREGKHILPSFYESFLEQRKQERASEQASGSNYSHLPDYTPFDFIYPNEVSYVMRGMQQREKTPYFSATPRLLDAATRALANMPAQPTIDGRPAQLHVGGNGVTGSVFLDNREYRKWVHRVFNAEITEMESAAIGQVCTVNEVDWVIIRAVSDLAGGQEGENTLNDYNLDVSRIGANALFAVLDELLTTNK